MGIYWGPYNTSSSNVSLLLHMDGANNSTTFTDSSTYAHSISVYGNAKISTTQSKFGGSSGYFDMSSYIVTSASSPAFDFGIGDFTLEAWMRLGGSGSESYPAIFYIGSGLTLRFGDSGFGYRLQFGTNSQSLAGVWNCAVTQSNVLNTWKHVAFTRSDGKCRLFLDGILQYINNNNSYTYPYTYFTDSTSFTNVTVTNGIWNGYLDEVQVIKGLAKYTSDFTVPSAPFPNS